MRRAHPIQPWPPTSGDPAAFQVLFSPRRRTDRSSTPGTVLDRQLPLQVSRRASENVRKRPSAVESLTCRFRSSADRAPTRTNYPPTASSEQCTMLGCPAPSQKTGRAGECEASTPHRWARLRDLDALQPDAAPCLRIALHLRDDRKPDKHWLAESCADRC
jgi:hypothetical protein